MGIRAIVDETRVTYGPYRDGDKPEFDMDPAEATVSFDIFADEIRDSRLVPYKYNTVSYYVETKDENISWCVTTSDGKVADCIENLYFTFPIKAEDTTKTDTDDEVNHPKHYAVHKIDVECIMFTELLPSLAANAFKYVWRCDDRGNKTEDLEKALWYLHRACEKIHAEHGLGQRIESLMLEIIKSSDFDGWHKFVLANIVKGYYVDAYNSISDLIGKPRFSLTTSEF